MADELDEPIEVVEHDPRWASWYASDAAELRAALGRRLRAVEHFGSTAVPGLAAKPIVDVLVAPFDWPLAEVDRESLGALAYAYFGEAGIDGREYFRRRREHATNLAVVGWSSALWTGNVAVRDDLRAHPEEALRYAEEKRRAWNDGARTLLSYSKAKERYVAELAAEARDWQRGLVRGSGLKGS